MFFKELLFGLGKNQRLGLGLSIAIVLLISNFVNHLDSALTGHSNGKNIAGENWHSRNIASIETMTIRPERLLAEAGLAAKLRNASLEKSHIITPIDQLIFGTLQGHYGYSIKNGKLHEINLAMTESGRPSDPIFILDRMQFLSENRGLIFNKVDKITKTISDKDSSGNKIEIFEVRPISSSGSGFELQKPKTVRLILDEQDRLLSVSFQD